MNFGDKGAAMRPGDIPSIPKMYGERINALGWAIAKWF
jgi:hypothetical protein